MAEPEVVMIRVDPSSIVQVHFEGKSVSPVKGVVSAHEVRMSWVGPDGDEREYPVAETRFALVVPDGKGSVWVVPIESVTALLVDEESVWQS